MNYPIWSLPNPGLLIAFVAIVHVFISHFAVGGGFFLVLAERKARRERDTDLLGYVRLHSRFFILLTLVLGAITGVGIWFTIGLVHPQATSALITIFVWVWAIEWTFFVTEIAAATVYYYGWDRLNARTHERVGWIYAVSAWLSLVVINGILSFMLTPGDWLATGSTFAGVLNPTYWPSLAARTCTAFGLAGLYALLTAARLPDPALKERVTRYAARWVYLMSVALPIGIVWFVWAASGAGVQVGEVLGVKSLSPGDLAGVLLGGSASGHPSAIAAARTVLAGSAVTLLLTIYVAKRRPRSYGPGSVAVLLFFAFTAVGSGEWVREDIRKPYVIGRYMFVNGVRAAPEWAAAAGGEARHADRFELSSVRRAGILQAAIWTRLAPTRPGEDALPRLEAEGQEVFRLACSQCHSIDGYLAIRPLVAGRQQEALATMIGRFTSGDHAPADATSLWTWRGRRMPPFAGSDAERDALSAYLARLGGSQPHLPAPPAAAGGNVTAGRYFDENCSPCHGEGAGFPIGGRGRTSAQTYEMLGRLPKINDAMPAFEGSDELRKVLADYLATLPPAPKKGGAR
jgi:mono/diheme cytochrome c family protein